MGKQQNALAVVNYKGGVGKTTATFFLGAQLAVDHPRSKVLIIDIDAQCSLTTVFGLDPVRESQLGRNIFRLVQPGKPLPDKAKRDLYLRNQRGSRGFPENLYLLPGSFETEDLDVKLAKEDARGTAGFFARCAQVLGLFDDFGAILIDCPPNKMFLTQGMLQAAGHYLVVVIPDKVSVYGVPRLIRWVGEIPFPERPLLAGCLVNRVIRSPSGITQEQMRWVSQLEATLADRDLVGRNRGILGQWPNSNKVCATYGMGTTHLGNADMFASTSRQLSPGETVRYTASILAQMVKLHDHEKRQEKQAPVPPPRR